MLLLFSLTYDVRFIISCFMHCLIIMVLFNSGELINSADKLGATPLQTAAAWGHKSAEGKLFLYQVIAS